MATKTSGKRVKIQPIQDQAYRHEKVRALDDNLSWPSTIRTTSIVLSFILIVSCINPLPNGTLSIQMDLKINELSLVINPPSYSFLVHSISCQLYVAMEQDRMGI